MENNDIAFIQDGGPERTNIYFSQCIHCVHFDRGKDIHVWHSLMVFRRACFMRWGNMTSCYLDKPEQQYSKKRPGNS